MGREKGKLEKDMQDYFWKQKDLENISREFDKVQRLETQPVGGKGFTMSSTQNLSGSFGNMTTSFQVKADLDLGNSVEWNQYQVMN